MSFSATIEASSTASISKNHKHIIDEIILLGSLVMMHPIFFEIEKDNDKLQISSNF